MFTCLPNVTPRDTNFSLVLSVALTHTHRKDGGGLKI